MMNSEKQPELWNRLRRYRALRTRLERLGPGKVVQVCDTVRGSSKYFPYQERIFVISGVVSRRTVEHESLKKELDAEKTEIEDFIAKINDSLVRDILTLRFIGGLSWNEVAKVVGGGNTATNVRLIVRRFFCGR